MLSTFTESGFAQITDIRDFITIINGILDFRLYSWSFVVTWLFLQWLSFTDVNFYLVVCFWGEFLSNFWSIGVYLSKSRNGICNLFKTKSWRCRKNIAALWTWIFQKTIQLKLLISACLREAFERQQTYFWHPYFVCWLQTFLFMTQIFSSTEFISYLHL